MITTKQINDLAKTYDLFRAEEDDDLSYFAHAIYKLGRESMLTHGNCNTCSNKGTIYGLSQESTCERCVHQDQGRKNLYKEKSCV